MSFYQLLADYYDVIFPLNQGTLNFLLQHFNRHKASQVLDLACGSGSYSIALARKGFEVSGLDLDPAMIELAENKAASENFKKPPRFIQGDMLKLSDYFDRQFQAIFCIGNSLVHLSSEEVLQAGLNEMAQVLDPGGILIIQIVNYNRILKHKIKELPPIVNEKEGITFRRFYQHDPESQIIHFTGELTIEYRGTFSETVPLLALTHEKLDSMLQESGFINCSFWGGFSQEPWEPDSPATIVKGRLAGRKKL